MVIFWPHDVPKVFLRNRAGQNLEAIHSFFNIIMQHFSTLQWCKKDLKIWHISWTQQKIGIHPVQNKQGEEEYYKSTHYCAVVIKLLLL